MVDRADVARRRAVRGAPRGRRPATSRSSSSSSTRRTCCSTARRRRSSSRSTQTVRLIRSKGVGVFFVTQTPKDMPGGRARPARQPRPARAARVHAGRREGAPRDRLDVPEVGRSTTSRSCSRSSGSGEAAVTILSESGVPTPVVHTRHARRRSRAWRRPTTSTARRRRRPLYAKYGDADRQPERAGDARRAARSAAARRDAVGADRAAEGRRAPPPAGGAGAIGDFLQSSSGRALTREVVRGVFGMLKKGL